MTGFRPPPKRHWRSYDDDPLQSAQEAMDEPFAAFPSWFLRVECDRCGKVAMINESNSTQTQRFRSLREFIGRPGCGGQPGKAVLLTGIVAMMWRINRRKMGADRLSLPETNQGVSQ